MFGFDYQLIGKGWARAVISDDAEETVLTASYLSDALRHLVEAVAIVVEGADEARCSWDEEPGEYRWIWTRQADQVHLRVLAFDELWGDKPDDAGRQLFETTQDALRIGRVILSACQRLVDRIGEEEYRCQWVEHPFPATAVERLRTAIRET